MDDAPSCPTSKVEDLWFPDGSLVICAGQKLFKVSKFVLAARSSVFRDMVALPPQIADDLYDAIFDSSYFEPPPSPALFSSVAGILRVAHKYDVNYLFKPALQHLEVFFPSCGVLPEPTAMQYYRRFTADGTFWLILVGATWLLPAAYYFASLFSLDDLYAVPREADWDEYDIVLCSRVRQFFSSHHATALVHFTTPDDNAHCAQPTVCILGRQKALQLCLKDAAAIPDTGILSSWLSRPESKQWQSVADAGYCSECLAHSQDKFRAQCQLAWDGLPKKLELGTWDNLAALRHSVMNS
ncbi:hypothetical protein C8F01DRAFT_1276341 [Mycena amicta]|nr:hypothetical protein C8F01DRAFT_1276341 [Mycena amicta]